MKAIYELILIFSQIESISYYVPGSSEVFNIGNNLQFLEINQDIISLHDSNRNQIWCRISNWVIYNQNFKEILIILWLYELSNKQILKYFWGFIRIFQMKNNQNNFNTIKAIKDDNAFTDKLMQEIAFWNYVCKWNVKSKTSKYDIKSHHVHHILLCFRRQMASHK